MAEGSVPGRDDGHRLPLRIAALGRHTPAYVFGNLADILHHGRNVGEYLFVFALENVIGRAGSGSDEEGVVDESFAQRIDR